MQVLKAILAKYRPTTILRLNTRRMCLLYHFLGSLVTFFFVFNVQGLGSLRGKPDLCTVFPVFYVFLCKLFQIQDAH